MTTTPSCYKPWAIASPKPWQNTCTLSYAPAFGGYTQEEFDNQGLINENYVGIRPAPGYPSCPEHTEKALIWDLLEVEQRIGMKLTESYAMWPAASVCGWYFTHPASNYFTLGRIDEDQAQDYAKRKGWDEREMMKWLGVAMK